jgi:MoxR-like ATPase
MSDWALSTNLYTWAQVQQGFFGWPSSQAEADKIRTMKAGDLIVPKYAQLASWNPQTDSAPQQAYLEAIGADPETLTKAYDEKIAGGAGAVPHVLRVLGAMEDDARPGLPWARVSVAVDDLPYPLSTKEFLRLRAVPPATAAQFKGTVSPGRHVQELPDDTAAAVLAAGQTSDREDLLRHYSLGRASSAEQAVERLSAVGRTPKAGDRAYLVTSGGLLGVFECVTDGALKSVSSQVPRPPAELIELLQEAKRKARKGDYFAPTNAEAALVELQALLDGAEDVTAVDDFGRWHDRYELLVQKINQAYELAQRTEPPRSAERVFEAEGGVEGIDETEAEEAAALAGLTIEAVRAELPEHVTLPDDVLREVVTALRAGKHLLLGGPPGTGKSTLAEAVARAVVGSSYEVTTATADWTTFDTIGGYLPDPDKGVEFFPGVVLRSLRTGSWLIIDEMNRADIDKAFGALFTLLNGEGGAATRRATLPYHDSGGVPISITWSEHRHGDSFAITPHWRLIGTLNLADKASLFQLSFAFLRRFAVIDIPLPRESEYSALLNHLFSDVPDGVRESICKASLEVAYGPPPIGPAILTDVARFVSKAIAPVAAGGPTFSDPVDAFLVGVKVMVVSQYEGAEPGDGKKLVARMSSVWPDRPEETWKPLMAALDSVALK